MKLFAFFLPQYHSIPENDEWWGKGFTEWTNVKKALPLFNGHVQPKHPLDNNYYNLLDKKTVEWQTKLMKLYHVDGMIYYHYYFTGKKLLEKPAENLLRWKDIEQDFFFCWANHSWYKAANGNKTLLIEQKYGDRADWEEHFNYLLPFFKDKRYQKIDNKPVFMLFKSDFPEKNAMLKVFEEKSIESGFKGLYIIETFHDGQKWPVDYLNFKNHISPQTERIFLREPVVNQNVFSKMIKYYPYRLMRKCRKTVKKILKIGYVDLIDGNILFDITREKEKTGKEVIHGISFSWDNTPRHGYRGYVLTAPSKENFMKTMDAYRSDDYVFINAWNEWAEGMMLEPTEEDGYKYLEWINEWVENERKCNT